MNVIDYVINIFVGQRPTNETALLKATALLNLDEDAVLNALDDLRRVGMLVDRGDDFYFIYA